jgi:uncharacterized protein YciI
MLFSIRCIDRADAPGLRAATRPVHLEYLKSLGNRIVLAGPVLGDDEATPIGSQLIVDGPDRAGAAELAAGDPYAKAGLFAEVIIEPFRLVFLNPPPSA